MTKRVSSFLSVRSSRSNSASSNSALQEKGDSYLPSPSAYQKPKMRVRQFLGNCLYRRVVLWSLAVVFIVSVIFLKTAVHTTDGQVVGSDGYGENGAPPPPELQDGGPDDHPGPPEEGDMTEEERKQREKENLPSWIEYQQ